MCTNSAERFPPWLSRRPWAPSSAAHQPLSESVHMFLQQLEWLVNDGQLLLQVKNEFASVMSYINRNYGEEWSFVRGIGVSIILIITIIANIYE